MWGLTRVLPSSRSRIPTERAPPPRPEDMDRHHALLDDRGPRLMVDRVRALLRASRRADDPRPCCRPPRLRGPLVGSVCGRGVGQRHPDSPSRPAVLPLSGAHPRGWSGRRDLGNARLLHQSGDHPGVATARTRADADHDVYDQLLLLHGDCRPGPRRFLCLGVPCSRSRRPAEGAAFCSGPAPSPQDGASAPLPLQYRVLPR